MATERFGWPETVVILSSRDDVVAGINPMFVEGLTTPHVVTWWEGGHARAFEIESVERSTPEEYAFTDREGDTFRLLPMTLELYEKHVRPKTMGKVKFSTEAELTEAMRREW